mmetsp:Transcript_68410/g.154943  ORF Transcript_68410/g.154943 Transcript_68410/m.154943 type:complete len:329 (+) Transcript_68410:60-1046(+)
MPCLDFLGKLGSRLCGKGEGAQHVHGSKAAFVRFVQNAARSKKSPEYAELYTFLLDCFVQTDLDFDGRIGPDEFDMLVERAASLPRRWGFAPTSSELFHSSEERREHRKREFAKINTSCSGHIAFDEWLAWSYDHICEKAPQLDAEPPRSRMESGKEDFKKFIIAAVRSRHSPEYKELYHFLQECFTKADKDMDGRVSRKEFDELIEIAASAPRRFGFAPPSQKSYRGKAERLLARWKMVEAIHAEDSGFISNQRGRVQFPPDAGARKRRVVYSKPFKSEYVTFDEWLGFAYGHICQKAQTLDPSLPGEMPAAGGVRPHGATRCPYGF